MVKKDPQQVVNDEELIPMYMRLGSQDPLDLLIEEEKNSAVLDAVSTLGQRLQMVLQLRFGINAHVDIDKTHTLAECGKIMGVHRARVHQLEQAALRRLRHPSRGMPRPDDYNRPSIGGDGAHSI